jgi:predicted nucleic acid-binding protein
MLYIDSSAWVALYRQEEQRRDIVRAAMATFSWRAVGSRLVEVETERSLAVRAARPEEARDQIANFRLRWSAADVLAIDDDVWEDAKHVAVDARLRSGDAIHLALLRRIGVRSAFLLTFDERLGRAAQAQGFSVLGGVV